MTAPVSGFLEFGLYVEDVARSVGFYGRVFGFDTLFTDDRMAAIDVGGTSVLLLFRQGASSERIETPAGVLPPHDARGTSHAAFSVPAGSLSTWEMWLAENDIEIEGRMRWERGGESLYFRDPDEHLLEVATPGLWKTY
ncbi:MAG: VOC family protein [Gemmatimonadota bacterium]|nr:VOC family protein [Gemmatimonadota bacterium]